MPCNVNRLPRVGILGLHLEVCRPEVEYAVAAEKLLNLLRSLKIISSFCSGKLLQNIIS